MLQKRYSLTLISMVKVVFHLTFVFVNTEVVWKILLVDHISTSDAASLFTNTCYLFLKLCERHFPPFEMISILNDKGWSEIAALV